MDVARVGSGTELTFRGLRAFRFIATKASQKSSWRLKGWTVASIGAACMNRGAKDSGTGGEIVGAADPMGRRRVLITPGVKSRRSNAIHHNCR